MELVTYLRGETVGFGARKDDGILDLSRRTGFGSLKALIAADALDAARAITDVLPADFSARDVTLLPPIPDPDKIICVGLNYHDHVVETGRTLTEYPTLFTRFASTLVGHDAALVKPRVSDKFDYEGELAVIVGRGGRHIRAEDAMDHVAGYSVFNDGSVRDWQGHTSQFTPGKNFVATGGFGPALVSADSIDALDAVELVTRFNGEVVQRATMAQMITPIPQLIAYISTFTRLEPGDLIVTGTPGGVGMKRNPPLYMKPGDVVEIEISGIGLLRNRVVAEA